MAAFGTIQHDIHRKRRAAVSPFFSKRSVLNSEPLMHENLAALCRNIEVQIKQKGFAEMRKNYLALSTDILCDHMFDNPLGLLKSEEAAVNWQETIKTVAELTPLVKQFTWLLPVALRIPVSVLQILVPRLARIVSVRKVSCLRGMKYAQVSNTWTHTEPFSASI